MPKKLQKTLHMTHLLKLLDKMHRYGMDPTRTVDAKERTPDAGRVDEHMKRTSQLLQDHSRYKATGILVRSWLL